MTKIFKSHLFILSFVVLLALLEGCTGIEVYMPPVSTPQLTAAQESKIGAAAEKRLIQMLGGRFHDKALAKEVKSLGQSFDLNITVADRSAAEIYPLPGQRVLITRGLLSQLKNRRQLNLVLQQSSRLAGSAYADNATRGMIRASTELLSEKPSPYDPAAADIRIAKYFADNPCAGSCLEVSLTQRPDGGKPLPEAIEQLKDLLPGYELLAKGLRLEKSGEQGRAISTYLQAASVTPDQPHILGTLGTAYLRAGQPQSARLHLQKAKKLQPANYRTQMGLGYLYLQLDKIDKASTALAESVRLLPITENLFLLAEAREKSGDIKGALALYRRVVDSDRYSKLGRSAASRLKQSKGRE